MDVMNGSFVFSVGNDNYHIPFTMERMGERVKVNLDTKKFGDIGNELAVKLNVGPFAKIMDHTWDSKYVFDTHFYVTSEEFEDFKTNVINQGVEWRVAPKPLGPAEERTGAFAGMHNVLDKMRQSFNPRAISLIEKVTIRGSWIDDPSPKIVSKVSKGGRRSSHKKRKSQKKCKSHKRISHTKSHRRH
jgi:hypothetical protein